jgi:hypothetical protein
MAAGPRALKLPAVVGADQAVALNDTQRKLRAPMRALVSPRVRRASSITPQNNCDAQNLNAQGLLAQIRRIGYRVPMVQFSHGFGFVLGNGLGHRISQRISHGLRASARGESGTQVVASPTVTAQCHGTVSRHSVTAQCHGTNTTKSVANNAVDAGQLAIYAIFSGLKCKKGGRNLLFVRILTVLRP